MFLLMEHRQLLRILTDFRCAHNPASIMQKKKVALGLVAGWDGGGGGQGRVIVKMKRI